jgi:TM2 domain-containing membrane protein YozV
MESQKLDMFLMTNAKFFDGTQLPMIKEQLSKLDDSKFIQLQSLNLKDPSTILIVSILGGNLGIDRFMLGETGLGVAKLLTCGGLGIWTIVDWFIIQARTKETNLEKVNKMLAFQ